ncbi:OmpA family protein [Roseomonas frigidaquae]|uniref:OmpA family protein n=1 Tax=Falsiroseomonas frigidaquae TaxID=487318 RepID=A0ABX1ES02_9PROT|nr:flagellar motor protein MotB [Falsiroseomonas frigidaquae]NKE43318.1 OmpA family protein [Falsiroseomonas frigidaquae]
MPRKGRTGENAPIVIKRVAAEEDHAHHGGAWKIAYADFVTAMMAFFLLMWLVNATTEAQRRGIADYFAQPNEFARGASGSGQPFGGRSLHSDGPLISESPVMPQLRQGPTGPDAEDEEDDPPEDQPARPRFRRAAAGPPEPPQAPGNEVETQRQRSEARRAEVMARAAEEIRQAVRNDPTLAQLGRQLMVEEVKEGLRIQLVDAEGQPVFQTSQAAPNERGRALLARVAGVLGRLPHPIEITGHTDAAPFRGTADRSNWDLSAERANATRRLLVEGGIGEARMRSVSGRADRDLLVPGSPLDAANRRVAVLMVIPESGESAP